MEEAQAMAFLSPCLVAALLFGALILVGFFAMRFEGEWTNERVNLHNHVQKTSPCQPFLCLSIWAWHDHWSWRGIDAKPGSCLGFVSMCQCHCQWILDEMTDSLFVCQVSCSLLAFPRRSWHSWRQCSHPLLHHTVVAKSHNAVAHHTVDHFENQFKKRIFCLVLGFCLCIGWTMWSWCFGRGWCWCSSAFGWRQQRTIWHWQELCVGFFWVACCSSPRHLWWLQAWALSSVVWVSSQPMWENVSDAELTHDARGPKAGVDVGPVVHHIFLHCGDAVKLRHSFSCKTVHFEASFEMQEFCHVGQNLLGLSVKTLETFVLHCDFVFDFCYWHLFMMLPLEEMLLQHSFCVFVSLNDDWAKVFVWQKDDWVLSFHQFSQGASLSFRKVAMSGFRSQFVEELKSVLKSCGMHVLYLWCCWLWWLVRFDV